MWPRASTEEIRVAYRVAACRLHRGPHVVGPVRPLVARVIMTTPTHYEVLGVSPRASAEEIRNAYRAAARRLHPDAVGGTAAAMQRLNASWHVLRDPGRRTAYDRMLAGDHPGLVADLRPSARPGDPPDGSEEWEGVAEDLLDDTPFRPTQALEGWWALAPPAALALAVGLLLGAFVFGTATLLVFSGGAFFLAVGLFILAPLRAMTTSRSDGSEEHH